MKSAFYTAAALAVGATNVAAHATFQDLWVDGVDNGATCARLPLSNSPVQDVTSTDIACNAGTSPVSGKCSVAAGSTVTVEMHQQPGDRSCANEAIGGDHYGPVQAYMASVADASTAVGSDASWFKVFADTWSAADGAATGDSDNWGTKDLNTCCGLMSIKIPEDIAPGDYLLRSEVIALHVASSLGQAQFYMTCYQITVTGSGTAEPAGVELPGAYAASDPGILLNIHAPMSTYIAPGPTVYSAGSTKSAGSPCEACETTCQTAMGPATTLTKRTKATATGPSHADCTASPYSQCGGTGWTGCTTCEALTGTTCISLNETYSQCL